MEFTNSTYFLLRGLNIVKMTETVDESYIYTSLGFRNAYIADIKRGEDLVTQPLYLLFKPPHMESFNEFLDYEYETGTLKEDYDYPGGYVVLLYDFPSIFRDDYKLVLEGKYSKLSDDYKKMFPMTYRDAGKVRKTQVYHIFNRTSSWQAQLEIELGLEEGFLNDSELWSSFNMDKETLDIDKIINDVRNTENKGVQ